MIRVEEATPSDFERIQPLFSGFKNPKITRAQWRSLFDYPWTCDTQTRGFVLLDDDKVAGFFGTIWSEREIAGRPERFCNLTSWITLPDYRNQSLLLLKSVLALEHCTITCHSPAGNLYPLYRRFGFSDLETKLRIILPWPSWHSPAQWLGYKLSSHPNEIAPHLDAANLRLLEAHRSPACGHLLIRAGTDSCYLIFTRTKGKRFHFSHVHYVSNRELFARAIDRIKLHLLRVNRTPLIMIDARLVAGLAIPHSREADLGVPHIFRSTTLAPEQIDNLFSELILLGL